MIIRDDIRLSALQREFNERFPALKIEFYRRPHQLGEGSNETHRLSPRLTVGNARVEGGTGQFVLDGSQKTGDFEQMLREIYGLNVQVFRRSYHRWLQTWATDVWTLDEQNRRGAIMGEKGGAVLS